MNCFKPCLNFSCRTDLHKSLPFDCSQPVSTDRGGQFCSCIDFPLSKFISRYTVDFTNQTLVIYKLVWLTTQFLKDSHLRLGDHSHITERVHYIKLSLKLTTPSVERWVVWHNNWCAKCIGWRLFTFPPLKDDMRLLFIFNTTMHPGKLTITHPNAVPCSQFSSTF